ncbi:salivary proline-rich protein, related [Neospora caninum Liverpool]|uniref:Salivary proline-rich protein, related n=1 Tax=Neospora caninum (strain Liverpool) TaxID=572307 RepID=F0VCC4_NEOCL|nr:salivary proline-rich protein, related [Neospora caninum Liverpool]CBZ51258.1 salivary proline-rich protein, related [Neospora caninum Liverpool]|eukprot:XP_003881291.1 salivary proline-rich protein, related [Neospora caninum Liverpool]
MGYTQSKDSIERDFDRLYQRAYMAEVQLNNLKAAASRTTVGGASYSVTQLVKLATNLLELLTKQPDQPCVSVIPDALACLSMCHVNANEWKTRPIGRPSGDVAPDLKWLATVSDDLSWLKWADQWDMMPMDLRWVSIAVDDRTLLLHRLLWARAPVDLRYLTVVSGNMDWLYIGPDRWNATPMQLRMRAIALEDPTIIRPSMTEAALYGHERDRICNTLTTGAESGLPILPSPHAPEEDLDLTLRISLSPADIATCANTGEVASTTQAMATDGESRKIKQTGKVPAETPGQIKDTTSVPPSKVGMAKTVASPLSKTVPSPKADAAGLAPSKAVSGPAGGSTALPSPSKLASPPPKDGEKPSDVAKKAAVASPPKAEGAAAAGSVNAAGGVKAAKGPPLAKKGPGPLGVKGGAPLPRPGETKEEASSESATAKVAADLPKGTPVASKSAVPGKAAPLGPGKEPPAPGGKTAPGAPVGGPKAEVKKVPPVGGPKTEVKKDPPVGGPKAEVKKVPPVGGPKAEVKKVPPVGGPKAEVKKVPPVGGPKAEVKKVPPVGGPKAEVKKIPPGGPLGAPKADGSPQAAQDGGTLPKAKLGPPPGLGKVLTSEAAESIKETGPAKKSALPGKGVPPLGKKGPPLAAKVEEKGGDSPPAAAKASSSSVDQAADQNEGAGVAGTPVKKGPPLGKGPPPKKAPLVGKKAPTAPEAPDAKADDAPGTAAKKGPPKGLPPKGKAPPKGKGFL